MKKFVVHNAYCQNIVSNPNTKQNNFAMLQSLIELLPKLGLNNTHHGQQTHQPLETNTKNTKTANILENNRAFTQSILNKKSD